MPAVTDGLAQITIDYSFNNTQASNVFYYWNGTNTPIVSLSAIISAVDTKLMTDLAALCTLTTSFTAWRARDVFGILVDESATPSLTAGTRAGELNNNFTTSKIRLNGSTKETKIGWKRIGGISEIDVAGNGLTSAYIILVQNFAALLNDTLTVGAETYTPVIYGQGTLANPTRRVVNPIVSTFVPNEQTSQNSRKR